MSTDDENRRFKPAVDEPCPPPPPGYGYQTLPRRGHPRGRHRPDYCRGGRCKGDVYKHFASKDELVRAYIEEQDRLGRAAIAQLPTLPPREKIFAIMARIGEATVAPGYRGCPYLNAAAEYPDPASPVRQAIDIHREWYHDLLEGLLTANNDPTPSVTAALLVILGDGLLVSGELDDPAKVAKLTREAVSRLLG